MEQIDPETDSEIQLYKSQIEFFAKHELFIGIEDHSMMLN